MENLSYYKINNTSNFPLDFELTNKNNRPRGMVWGGKWEGGSGWGTRVHLWQIHVDVWQNQDSIVK